MNRLKEARIKSINDNKGNKKPDDCNHIETAFKEIFHWGDKVKDNPQVQPPATGQQP